MEREFANKVVLVTGAASGIGKATALVFAEQGANVVVADIGSDGCDATVELIKAAGGNALAITADISDETAVRSMLDSTIKHYGRLDHACNNAGILGSMLPLTADYSVDTFDKVIAVNLRGTWLCMKYEIPLLLKSGGTIVNTASIAGLVGFPTLSAYVAGKHGILGLTKTAALEYATQNIRINAVCPGGVRTPMAGFTGENDAAAEAASAQYAPNGRVAEPEEIADAIMWLSSNRSSYVNGHGLVVDAGSTVR
ncbi:MAG: SDR family oxidoreductase [Gammaproteobacteria bacterium]|nr:SDR family oxidoreductase [Gammaproteobacteria bacterium]MDH5653377.1 SDR family oxidoreductase [Gammaproteobacteria bacterium]